MTVRLPAEIPLPGGRHLAVRDATPDDVDAVVRLYESLSLDDRYRRFFAGFHPRASFVATWLSAGQRGGRSLVAESCSAEGTVLDLVAEAGYAPTVDGSAEFAIAVAHDWRGWLGPYLLDVLVELAHDQGFALLEAEVLTENRPMREVIEARGAVVLDRPDVQIVRLAISTDGSAPPWPPAAPAPRVVVEAPGGRWRADTALRKAGLAVADCGGLTRLGGGDRCPALAGDPCPLAQGATVIVCAFPPDDPRSEQLRAAHERLHPQIPVLLDTPGDLGACRTSAEVVRRIEAVLVERPADGGGAGRG